MELDTEVTRLYKLRKMCEENIARIDRLSDNAIATDVDIGMAYVYRKVLHYIEKGE